MTLLPVLPIKLATLTELLIFFVGDISLVSPSYPIAYHFRLIDAGHISILEKARQQCDYLIVGVHDDETVNEVKGPNYPLLNLHERVLSVLSCRVCFIR